MKKQILSANNIINSASFYNSFGNKKDDFIVHIPNDADVNTLKSVFGVKNTKEILETINKTIQSLEGKSYKVGADVTELEVNIFIFVVKDVDHNVFVSVVNGDTNWTVFVGYKEGYKDSFMRRFMDFCINLPA